MFGIYLMVANHIMKPFHPRKRFGQHFLRDPEVIQRLIHILHPQKNEHFVEIGPGDGALTFAILPLVTTLEAVELDRELIPLLTAHSAPYGKLILYQGDALSFDFTALAKIQPLRIIGNLPYNISTPLLFHLFAQTSRIRDMHFMVQKEVAERLTATPGTKSYGRLTVMAQYHCNIDFLFSVANTSFFPPPKVESAIIRLLPHSPLPWIARDYNLFAEIVNTAFQHRRKTLANALKKWIAPSAWTQWEINSQLRPEMLTVRDFVTLANKL